MLPVIAILLLTAFGICIASALNPPKAPLWVAVLLVIILMMIQALPR